MIMAVVQAQTQTQPKEEPAHEPITYNPPGLNVMLQGDSGTGKTYSLTTFLDADIEIFILFTEPGMSTIGKALLDKGLPSEKIHWKYIKPADTDWDIMLKNAKMISALSYESLAKLKTGMGKEGYTQWFDLLIAMNDFVDDRTGEHFGDVGTWNSDRVIVVDGLSGCNTMSIDLTVGAKPTKHEGEWGVAMDNEHRFLQKMCLGTQCHFVLITHLQPGKDMLTGQATLIADALGSKLAPKLPKDFDEVLLSLRKGSEFFWSTSTSGITLKTRLLPLSDKLDPDFNQLIKAWVATGGSIEKTEN